MTDTVETKVQSGLTYALAAYTIWGFVPLFFALLKTVPAVEVLAQRILWALPLCVVIMAVRGQLGEYRAALRDWKIVRILLVSATLVTINWLIYIHSINTDHVLAASLGYYLNPLVNVMLGMFFLGERLSKLQGIAVAIAGIGVALLLAGALDTLWISLTLAFSFGIYGLLRKLAPVGSVPGLAIETTLLFPLSLAAAIYFVNSGDNVGFAANSHDTWLLIAGGAVTAIPLLLFAVAARLMSYAALGFVQFLAPSIAFFLSLFVFHEPLKPAQLACFLLIWTSIAVFSYDMWQKMRAARVAV